ncbi:CbtB-domain containing protein [Roseomonas gilardii subsp. gilardii]|uniref:CbtB domain-containing protein n=1 Tax=Roseomonas gilardii TaxID=257708 RepID=UPI001FFB5B69|nr:CbtB domain-containing protein [Roseomonas gilardii]UPG72425.1 CbtB-domain containing protein [Roseomonas gilardii subsp. gilardii]
MRWPETARCTTAFPPPPASPPGPPRAALAALLSAALGAVLLWGVGFAHADALHNAAHDTRHSNGFPCH